MSLGASRVREDLTLARGTKRWPSVAGTELLPDRYGMICEEQRSTGFEWDVKRGIGKRFRDLLVDMSTREEFRQMTRAKTGKP